ncbi:hypothetical protein RclHR1_13730007 [Rhizophagus clarus]|uniref:Uncharacterized protein n=1 Tax=Rhizophagus clarus TaxID=94130 RepID=A0A2Z6QAU6_9GLOM|nr:hypothetical protein RclHR1_13730007 [Rhizophagus clarus]GES83792.1 hypothetical protein GLOIN_2v1783661 [Rhizophagus clarus]
MLTGSHLISWITYQAAYIAQLADKCGRSLPHKWYLDIQAHTTIPDSHDHLHSHFVCSSFVTPTATLIPGVTTTQKNRHWLVTLDGHDAPLFGKQLSVQPKKDTCVIVHWTSDCLSFPGDVICFRPWLGCDAHIPFSLANKYAAIAPRCTFTIFLLKSLILPTNCERIGQTTTEVISTFSWANLYDTVTSYSRRLDISPDFSSSSFVVDDDLIRNSPSCGSSCLPSPIILPPGSHYRFYTDGSLINLGLPDVSIG